MVKIIKSDARSVLSFIKDFLPPNPVVVEAGAFRGFDTVVMAECWPQGTIYAFEPVPQLFTQLQTKAANYQNIICYQCALSDKNGQASFHLAQRPEKLGIPTQAGSLLKPKERLTWSEMQYSQEIIVPTITLDSWAQATRIDKLDFLWLDVQGYALPILQAMPTLLKTIQVIYVEVEFIEAYEGQACYQQVREWLEQQGFVVKAVDFVDQTSWFFGNVVFVRSDLAQKTI